MPAHAINAKELFAAVATDVIASTAVTQNVLAHPLTHPWLVLSFTSCYVFSYQTIFCFNRDLVHRTSIFE